MTNTIRTKLWGDVSFGIDNHFQLLLYISENDCQLEISIFLNFLFFDTRTTKMNIFNSYLLI
ncbi:hypothetical protein CD149_00025 [Staphylococcus condimenti]|uniref:Uncharacterized protein n=1 Tax=Staphylococcus condimenti TaxID=70255 RepID=A0A143P8F6_9STAP|nr:hypothetical protein A4G25_02175 [Staphylococcus condimenti]OFP01382.1 hypothetical protein HMPREF3007_09695 [Staphylococcus sp. HMSC065E08]PNZ65410.1 hypothetical protein CD149_00025 [Staphylococcus condimenti]RZI01322.1 hypothetical protein EIG98_10925 [Staphylococcus condimenti]RZI01361.1 hypothetical protein EIG99_09035 [Staphylococcus condimenti]